MGADLVGEANHDRLTVKPQHKQGVADPEATVKSEEACDPGRANSSGPEAGEEEEKTGRGEDDGNWPTEVRLVVVRDQVVTQRDRAYD